MGVAASQYGSIRMTVLKQSRNVTNANVERNMRHVEESDIECACCACDTVTPSDRERRQNTIWILQSRKKAVVFLTNQKLCAQQINS